MSEDWLVENMYCLHCGGKLLKKKNNNPVGDVYCSECRYEYELKACGGNFSRDINDGSYKSMMARINAGTLPSFFFLNYCPQALLVKNLFAIPKYFFTNEIITPRKPLSAHARRSNWIGCKIKLGNVPQGGKIAIIDSGLIIDKNITIYQFNKMLFINNTPPQSRGWLMDVLHIIEKLNKEEFSLQEIYAHEPELQIKHKANHHIKAKIRQQLQILRDNNYIVFIGKGNYRINS